MIDPKQAAQALSLTLLALMAGFYFAWSVSAAPGFAATPGPVYVEAMQRINEAVRNGWFGAAFFGAIPAAALALALGGAPGARPWLAGALALYLVSFAITVFGNVPINRAMELWDPAAPPADWPEVLAGWTRLNHLRACAALLAFLAALRAAFLARA